MKKLPAGVQSIRDIIEKGYVYVDKTGFAQDLIENGKHYFMSRPRRFGKSLFLDTLGEILKGNKELFKECAIYGSDYDWQKHPVLSFDFSQVSNRSSLEFEDSLKRVIQEKAKNNKLSIEVPTIQEGLKSLISELASQENQVAVLVDEYDYPIINNLSNLEFAQGNRDLIKSFFTTLKSLDKHLKMTFVTGVSKFSQVSLFSGPNNLTDLTMSSKYAGMMGYTEEELKKSFAPHIEEISRERSASGNETSEDQVLEEIRSWYNGYRFSREDLSVYNPYSTLRFLSDKHAESYWYSSGTPSFLIDQVKKHPESAFPLSGTIASQNQLMDISSLSEIDLVALMFQTGYLTVKSYNPRTDRYHLSFPNTEVKKAFIDSLVSHFGKTDAKSSAKCQEAMDRGILKPFFDQIKMLFANFPYNLFTRANEGTYHGMLLGIVNGMGFEAYAEKLTNIGRIDLALELPKITYVFEFKLDSSGETALKQIHEKKYFEPYMHKGKEIAIVGANFSSTDRNVSDWKGELLSESGKIIKELPLTEV